MKEIQINNKEMNNNKDDNNKDKTNDLSIVNKVKIFYKKNEKELLLLFGLLIVFNFVCPSRSIFSTPQIGGNVEHMAEEMAEGGQGKKKIWSRAFNSVSATTRKIPGGVTTSLGNLKKTNVFQSAIGVLFGLVKSLITFGGLILVLAIMPGLPIFIFMLILFFILRARVAALKSF
jgi:hypothetical protein